MPRITEIKYTGEEIESRRRRVGELFIIKSPNVKNTEIKRIHSNDLRLLFGLYDEVFFDGWFKKCYQGKLKFTLSKRMTKSAGKTICPKNSDPSRPASMLIEVRISVDFIFSYGVIADKNIVAGIETSSSLEALQIIFEHELVHVIEFIHYQKSNCQQERFRTLARNLFGHTESAHRLATPQQIARAKMGFNIGDRVSFTYGNKKIDGILYRITRRATVIVSDPRGTLIDQNGNRYIKYYVPLQFLEPERK